MLQDQNASLVSFWGENSPEASDGPHLAGPLLCVECIGEKGHFSELLLIWTPTLMISSNPNYLRNASSARAITLGLVSTYRFEREKNI